MGNISQKDIDLIENHLFNNDTPFKKKIQEEYNFLKNYKPIKIKENENNEDKNNISKGIINPIRQKKRLERFSKWFKMILSFENEIYDTISKKKKILNTSNNDFSNSENNKNIKINKKNVNEDSTRNSSLSLLKNHNNFELSLRKYYDLNKLLFIKRVKKGPPDSLRWLSWMIILNIPEIRKESIYQKYKLMKIEENRNSQIQKDITRTFINNNIKENEKKKKEKILYNILKSICNIDKECGYCQGINFITGFLLEISDFNEVETFYMLISLFSKEFDCNFNLRGFFIDNFPLLKIFLYIFDIILEIEKPDLKKHIFKLDIPHEVWIGKWIQTLYTICLPNYLNYRIWDNIICNGLFFVISFSISLIEILEKDLISLKEDVDFSEYFKNFFHITNGNGNPYSSLLYQFKENNIKCILLENIIENAQKKHNNYVTKNLFNNLFNEFVEKNSFCLKYSIKYNMDFSYNNNSNGIYMNNFHITKISNNSFISDSLKDESELSDSDNQENDINFIKFKNDNEYIFTIKNPK